MNVKEKGIGQIAVKVASKGEYGNIGKPKYGCDWHEFGKFVGIWIVTEFVLFAALLIITIVGDSENIMHDTIKGEDTLNMMFSLVLSALLEQIWSKNKNNGNGLYSFTLCVEGILTIIGGMLFVAYSIMQIVNPCNRLLQWSFWLNVIYIICSTIFVLLGFLSRAIREEL